MKNEPLPLVILAGGLATRLLPITGTIPKSLVPVNRVPFLTHQLKLLAGHGLRDIILCVGHLGEQIEAAYGDGSDHGVQIRYSYDGPHLRGTAGALRQALSLLGDAFLVLYGDSYLEIDYRAVQQKFLESNAPALMTVMENSHGTEPSNVWFENPKIRAYDKTNPLPQMRHIDYGLSAYRSQCFADYGGSELSGLQSVLAKRGEMAGVEMTVPYHEIGSPAGLKALEQHLQSSRL